VVTLACLLPESCTSTPASGSPLASVTVPPRDKGPLPTTSWALLVPVCSSMVPPQPAKAKTARKRHAAVTTSRLASRTTRNFISVSFRRTVFGAGRWS